MANINGKNSVAALISNYQNKIGRNMNSQLNPHNTQKKTMTSTLMQNQRNKIITDKYANAKENQADNYKFITSSVDPKKFEMLNNKITSLSPSKVIDTNRLQKSFHLENDNLNELINTISKNHEIRSRNNQRNNLTSSKSNLVNSDKAQTMQSGSYNKNILLTQALPKTSTVAVVTNNPIVKSNFKRNIKINSQIKRTGTNLTSTTKSNLLTSTLSSSKNKIQNTSTSIVKRNNFTSTLINNKPIIKKTINANNSKSNVNTHNNTDMSGSYNMKSGGELINTNDKQLNSSHKGENIILI